MNNQAKIIFMGTPEFGAIILEGLVKAGYEPALVITETDKPVGRKQVITPPPVKILAQKYNIPVEQPKILADYRPQIINHKPDLIIVVAYGQIIPKEILEIPKYECLNVHPSLLPKYRGPSPVQYAILNGDKETGVTIMKIIKKVDAGEIINSIKYSLSETETYEILLKKLAELGAELMVQTIPSWLKGEIKPKTQKNSEATYTKILKKEDGKINWGKTAKEIERQIRAFNPWPGSFTECCENEFKIKKIKIWKASVQKQTNTSPFGNPGKTYLGTNEQIAIQTGKDYLIIEELQPESGKRMLAKEFLKGRSDFIGTMLK